MTFKLKMSMGKRIAQGAHVAVKASHQTYKKNPTMWRKWMSGSHTKIVLGCDLKSMDDLIHCYTYKCVWVHDEGRTQVASGTLTAIAFEVMLKSQVPPELKELKLL